jgi:hypothetical protein
LIVDRRESKLATKATSASSRRRSFAARASRDHLRTQSPVATASGAAHFAPSVAPLAQTNETSSSSSPQLTVPVPVTTRKVAAGPGSPLGPGGPAAPGGPAGPCGPGSPRWPAGPVGPCAPGSPCGPWGPTCPWGPGGPVSPLSPAPPCGPRGPCGPCEPCGPAGPTGPGGPAGPGGPGGPCGPGAGSLQPAMPSAVIIAQTLRMCRIAWQSPSFRIPVRAY